MGDDEAIIYKLWITTTLREKETLKACCGIEKPFGNPINLPAKLISTFMDEEKEERFG